MKSAGAAPRLSFAIVDAGAEQHAAVPTLRFTLSIECAAPDIAIRSLTLNSQVRIATHRRGYSEGEQKQLAELFGTPDQWGDSLKSLLWTHTVTVVPPFVGRTTVQLMLPCTYDFDVVTAKYFAGIASGEVPLEFLFSGSVFYDGEHGHLQTARLTWESEARYRLPVSVWKDVMNHYFPNSSWLRIRRDMFEKLYAFRTARSLQTWEDTLSALLDASVQPVPRD